ncbi:MAG: 16S rRNA (uracil(1498)-N(3))-methyltransferase [Treponema sp.]|jgi:16S rRNA (uracil1498-N3)-methyltransferase|nr:16S rRNA (uracil(1498)-N(3))-methyltransferase [Treponema sp.]
MKQFLLRNAPGPGGIVHLYNEDYHYLARVRRLGPGDEFRAVLPGGEERTVKVLSTADRILIGECEGVFPDDGGGRGSPALPLCLFQALPKGAKMDLIVRQAAELGVWRVVPFESEYSIPKAQSLPASRRERWERIAREARQQSGARKGLEVSPPCAFDAMLAFWEGLRAGCERPVGVLLHQEPAAGAASFHEACKDQPDCAALAVGPEGGFSAREAARFAAAGWKPLVLGEAILRTETAALYGLAVLKTILSEENTWRFRKQE